MSFMKGVIAISGTKICNICRNTFMCGDFVYTHIAHFDIELCEDCYKKKKGDGTPGIIKINSPDGELFIKESNVRESIDKVRNHCIDECMDEDAIIAVERIETELGLKQ